MANQHFRNQPNQGNRNSHHPHGGGGFKQGVNRGGYPPRGQQGAHSAPLTPLTHIPSPYNFVPLSKTVVFPDWAEAVSHDIPFADGISGHLDIEIEAMTQLYIRNGGDHPEGKGEALAKAKRADSNYNSPFKLPGGRYAIPGTSLKGAIRNVLEIATFSKLRCDDRRFAVRDLRNRDLYTRWMTSGSGNHSNDPATPKPKAGWMEKQTDGSVVIYPCSYLRVEREDLINELGGPVSLRDKNDIADRYRAWGNRPLSIRFDLPKEDCQPNNQGRDRQIWLKYQRAKNIGKGELTATLVFTGQPAMDGDARSQSYSHKNGTKHMEFLFLDAEAEPFPVPEKIWREFLFIHTDENGNPGPSWKHWKPKFYKGERVPVFYMAFADKDPKNTDKTLVGSEQGAELHSIGLSLMYRLPYKNSIRDTLRKQTPKHLKGDLDFAETLFGRVSDPQKTEGNPVIGPDHLRGRIQFEPAVAIGKTAVPSSMVRTILGGPKASYYPNYIEQPNIPSGSTPYAYNAPYKTYMDDDAIIRGWKRYPVPKDGSSELKARIPTNQDGEENQNVQTTFNPLGKGAKFSGRIHFHNLRPVELGALLWAISLGDGFNNPRYRHSLGMAKPLGFGSIQIRITGSEQYWGNPKLDLEAFRQTFVDYMSSQLGRDYPSTTEIAELLATCDPAKAWTDDERKYPLLADKLNQFADAKGNKRDNKPHLALRRHSKGPYQPTTVYKAGANERGIPFTPSNQSQPQAAKRLEGLPTKIVVNTRLKCVINNPTKDGTSWTAYAKGGLPQTHSGRVDLSDCPDPSVLKKGYEFTAIVTANNPGHAYKWVND